MAAVTLPKRTTRGHNATYVEGTDDAVLSSLVRTVAGAVTLYGGIDTVTTSIIIGGSATASGAAQTTSIKGGTPDTAATAGGAVDQTGGAGNTSGAGGASSCIGGTGGSTDGSTSGVATLQSGGSAATNGNTANVVVDSGAATGSGTNGTVNIGATNAEAVSISRTGQATTVNGSLTVTEGLTVNGATTTASTTNLAVTDDLIIVNSDNAGAEPAGLVFERGSVSTADATVLWNEADDRFELGFFISANGTNTAPANLATSGLADIRFGNVTMSGTSITADAGLSIVTTTTGILTLDSGTTGAVNLGVDGTNAKTVTVGATASTSATVIDCGTGDLALGTGATAHEVNIGSATGDSGVTMNTGTGGIDIGTNAIAATVTIGNLTGSSSVSIAAGTGGIDIGGSTSVAVMTVNLGTGGTGAKTVTVGSLASTSSYTLQTGTGAMVFTAGGIFDVNATGALTMNSTTMDLSATGLVTIDSSGGAINIGADDIDQAINIGTQGERTISIATGAFVATVNIGNATGATLLNFDSGTGGITLDAPATADIALTVPADANSDILFSGHGQQHAFNSVADPTLDTSAQDLVGAINEVNAAASEPLQVVTRVVATTGLTVGRAAFVSALNVASHTDAQAVSTSEVVGFVKTIGIAGTGELVTAGVISVAVASGLAITAGDVLFLGAVGIDTAVAGQISNTTASFTTGDTIYEVGIANTTNGATSSDSLIVMLIRLGSRQIV